MSIDYSSPVDITALTAAIAAPLGGKRLEDGTFTLDVAQTDTSLGVVFATPFTVSPRVHCTVMPLGLAGQLVDVRWGPTDGSTGGGGTTTGFWFRARRTTGAASTIRVNWIAIGL